MTPTITLCPMLQSPRTAFPTAAILPAASCPPISGRYMMRVAEQIARKEECGALITGESLGQVASQTMQAIGCTDMVATMPVFRPLIGMDKTEIVAIAHRIGTFDISIEPYEDCCTIFTPKHPRTKPIPSFVEIGESALDIDALVEECVKNARYRKIGYRQN